MLPAIAGLLSAGWLAGLQSKTYQAQAKVLIRQHANEAPFDPQTGVLQDQSHAVELQAQLVTSDAVRARVTKLIGSAPPASATALAAADVVIVSAQARTPEDARTIADAYAQSYVALRREQIVGDLVRNVDATQHQLTGVTNQIKLLTLGGAPESQRQVLILQEASLRQQLDQLEVSAALRSGGAQLLSPASASSAPVAPKPALKGVLAGFAGGLLGLGALGFAHVFDDRITEAGEAVAKGRSISVIGRIPPATGTAPALVSIQQPESEAAEAYRSLRTAVRFMRAEHNIQVLQVTSANPGEGKSTTATNLAITIAAAGQSVCLASCDLRRPRIEEFLGLDAGPGFSSRVAGMADIDDVIVRVGGVPGLSVLRAGPLPPNPAELLSSASTVDLFAELRARFDVIVMDSPPVLPVTDAAILSLEADATVLVVAMGRTTRRQLDRTVELLEQVDAPVRGLVLNEARAGWSLRRKRDRQAAGAPADVGTSERPEEDALPKRAVRHPG
ncbi:MAG: Tyrosine-protein kinase Wzc [Acidimicrobiales bacterium]|nr:Tyrosine-protein kinase Wzc [Acidimicrobiales bacterium]